jgi:UDP-glucuronate decarboxylase
MRSLSVAVPSKVLVTGGAGFLGSHGAQTRSSYVDDLIEGFIRLMKTPDGVTGPINLGNPTEFTISELAQLIIQLTSSKSELIYEPLPSDDPRQRRPDTSVAESTLGWQAKTPLAEGLRRTIAYFTAFVAARGPAEKLDDLLTTSAA